MAGFQLFQLMPVFGANCVCFNLAKLLAVFLLLLSTTRLHFVNAVAKEYDLTGGTWWCTSASHSYLGIKERKLGFYDLARISADGPTESPLCNLYFINDKVPYQMYVDWERPLETTGKNVRLTLYTKYKWYQPWRVVWEIQGSQYSRIMPRHLASRLARLSLENPDNEPVSFQLTLRPIYGMAIDHDPWTWAVIVISIAIGIGLIILAVVLMLKRCRRTLI